MLEEVGSAIGLLRFKSGASIDPDTHGSSTTGEIRFGGDTETIGKGSNTSKRRSEDGSVVSTSWVRGAIFEESGIRLFETLEFVLHLLS